MTKSELIKTRDDYIDALKSEIYGPGSEVSLPDAEHELITSPPDSRYSIGILFPRDIKINAESSDTIMIGDETSDNPEEDVTPVELDVDIDEEEVAPKKMRKVATSNLEEESLDEEVSLATQNMPSSMGLTFFVNAIPKQIKCKVSFGTYRKALSVDCRLPFYPKNGKEYMLPDEFSNYVWFDPDEMALKLKTGGVTRKVVRNLVEHINQDSDEDGIVNALYRLADQLKMGYVRVPHCTEVIIDFSNNEYVDDNREIDGTTAKLTGMLRKIDDNKCSVTLMLVNDDYSKEKKSEHCILQPEIQICTDDNDFSFVDYSDNGNYEILNDEEKSLSLQYRNRKEYATGLGVSADWNVDNSGKGVIRTDFFPVNEVPSMDFNLPEGSDVPSVTLSMKYLSDLDSSSKVDKIDKLEKFVYAYEKWILDQKSKTEILEEKYINIAIKNIDGCTASKDRMLNGLRTLKDNDKAWDAFQLANRAMYMQRVHLKFQEKTADLPRYRGDEEVESLLYELEDYENADTLIHDYYSWRPFQLAFLLMSIVSIEKDKSKDRDIVDLIWFPTGGGKTEAYLGLTAFTIFYRRLAHIENADGTAVIMRYTLRLLAAQQFTRASTLICACECIRRDAMARKPRYKKYSLGNNPITIGLWIGREHTPNKNEEAKDYLKKLNSATIQNLEDIKEKNNKFQVLKCPWCGTKLVQDRVGNSVKGIFGYRMRNNRHFELFCPQEACFFSEGLPVQIVDEELFNNPPTLLFGTVDKFAMMPWKQEIGSFFAADSDNRAPELIIQDELHLISGPLGTMVGLYETAIDYICSAKESHPKIIASTATIRRAAEQCAALYNRDVAQFPHPGLDAEDSFFARESVIDYDKEIYGRKYVGLMPSGKTKAMMEVRTIAALMQRINMLDVSDEIKDKYWTLTAYFNSLKELGKTSTLVDDDIKDFIKRTAYRYGNIGCARKIGQADELTSRVSTTELNETLDKLEKIAYSKENLEKKRWPSNILLATNMISVGIDVARLNVMLLVGQPKLTSEYIQASSRVGRSYPGVAFTMYDGTKSRDRSHYEQFKSYHESFYRFVEPTSATPFSEPARKRALHAVLVALMRMTIEELASEKDAAKFTVKKYRADIEKIKDFILNRNDEITNRINPNMKTDRNELEKEIESFFTNWQEMAEEYDEDSFYYGEKFMAKHPSEGEGRLLKPFNTDPYDEAIDTMTSMRNVDSSVSGTVLIWEENKK